MSNFSSFLPRIVEITSWMHISPTQFAQISMWTDKHAQVLMLTILNGMHMSLCKVCVRL